MIKKGKKINKLASLAVCLVLFWTVIILPGSTTATEDDVGMDLDVPPVVENEPNPPDPITYDVVVADIKTTSMSDYPELIFVDTPTLVDITLNNEGDLTTSGIMVDVYEVTFVVIDPSGDLTSEVYEENEVHLTTLTYGIMVPGGETTQSVQWTPMQIGEHKLKLKLDYVCNSDIVQYEEVVTFVVMKNDLHVIEMNEDWIIDEDVTLDNVLIICNADIFVLEGATLTLTNSDIRAGSVDIWGLVIFTNVNFDVGCTFRGQYYIWVHDTGVFQLRGSSIFNNPPQFTYHFWVDGILQTQEWGRWSSIMHVWGEDSGGTETGGIMLRNTDPSQQSSFRWTIIRECDTIGIGCYGSSPTISPYVLIYYCGSTWGIGKGVYAEGSTANPFVQSCWLMYNGRNSRGHGARLRDGASATIRNSFIYRNKYSGVYCYHASSAVSIQSNSILYNEYYGVMDYDSSVDILGNTISSNRYGVYAIFSSGTISSNTITSGYYGIIDIFGALDVTDNSITSNEYLGMYMSQSTSSIEDNDIIDNSFTLSWHSYGGIYGYYSTPTIRNNIITSNDGWGIWMRFGAPTNAVTIGTDNTYSPENLMGRVWQEWWLRVLTADDDSGFVPNCYVEVIDQKSWPTPVWSGYSGSTGYTSTIIVTEYKIPNLQTSKDYYTPHTIRAEKDVTDYIYTAVELETMDNNKIVEVNFDFSRFAILIAPCNSPSEIQGFKGDISKMRDWLLGKGWQDSNIWFLTSGSEPYVDGDATRANVITALDDVATRSWDQDIVYLQFVDHGGGYCDAYGSDFNAGGRLDGSAGDPVDEDDDSYCSIPGGGDSKDSLGRDYDGSLCTKAGWIYDDEFADEMNDITCRYMVFVPVACFSGEFIEDCSNDFTAVGRIICTAAPENWYAWWNPPLYTFFAYYFHQGLTWTSSLGTHNPDTWYPVSNNNGRIEVEEAYAYAEEYDGPDEPKTWDWLPSTNLFIP